MIELRHVKVNTLVIAGNRVYKIINASAAGRTSQIQGVAVVSGPWRHLSPSYTSVIYDMNDGDANFQAVSLFACPKHNVF